MQQFSAAVERPCLTAPNHCLHFLQALLLSRPSTLCLCPDPLQVPSAALPSIQQRYRELQPLAAATLCSLLQQLRAGLPQALASGGAAAAGLLSLAGKALRGLRATLADANRLPEQQGMSSAAVAELLLGFVAAAQLAPPGSGNDEAAAAVAAAALDCASDLCSKFLGGVEASQQMLEVLLPKLQVGRWGS